MAEEGVRPYPLISDAIDRGDVADLIDLFRRFPEMIRFDVPGFGTWLHYAAGFGTADVVKYLLSIGFDKNSTQDRDGITPLKAASYEGNIETARCLLSEGAVIDTSASIRNPLFGAIVGSSPEIVRLLLDHGIDATVRYTSDTMDDMDAIAFALESREAEIAGLIADHVAGGDPDRTAKLLEEADAVMRRNNRLGNPPEDYG